MLNFLYTLIIYPIVQIIEFVFVFAQEVFKEPGISIMCVSGAVSALCLPLYLRAEKWQDVERDTQKRLKPMIDRIKAAFSGDERYMILSTYYRQKHYHPVMAMRNTFGLLIQIPFFIAAYSYLSHLKILKGAEFLFLSDLSKPDALLPVPLLSVVVGGGGGVSVNILPILMTFINVISGAVYTKNLGAKDRIQLYGMALVFLVLLYNSPAGLVFYWTLNNLFSLAKNCLKNVKNAKKIIFVVFCIGIILLDIYLLFFHWGHPAKRLAAAGMCLFFIFIPAIVKFCRVQAARFDARYTPVNTKIFLSSVFVLFLLAGLVIPSSLIASSVTEFSFIENYTSPFPFIAVTMEQSAGFFIVWGTALYCFFSGRVKIWFTVLFSILSIAAIIDTFVFHGDYGFLTTTLIFSNPESLNADLKISLINIGVLLIAAAAYIFIFFFKPKWKNILLSLQIVALLTLVIFGAINITKIYTSFSELNRRKGDAVTGDETRKTYQFSKQGKNVLVIMLDRAISGYVPQIFKEKPELLTAFRDFTYYPNCVSFGGYTLLGVPALFGGYEYVPEEMQKRSDELLINKYNEALLVLPRLFLKEGFSVTVTDPSFANFGLSPDLRIYDEYPGIHAENVHGRYTMNMLRNNPDLRVISISALLKNNLPRFSLFKITPAFLRQIIYDNGNYLAPGELGRGEITRDTLDNYANLDILPEITSIANTEKNTYTALVNDLTHEPAFFQAPDYVPANTITNKGAGPFAEEVNYHANMAALVLLGKWFDFLQRNGVYDNTRIIIASDHGWYTRSALPDNFTLPNGSSFLNFNPLLMVKDFNNDAQPDAGITTDNSFMTHADVPYLAAKDITKAENPFTHKPLYHDTSGGVTISTSHTWESTDSSKYTWKIRPDEWLHVKDDIFNAENWTPAGNKD